MAHNTLKQEESHFSPTCILVLFHYLHTNPCSQQITQSHWWQTDGLEHFFTHSDMHKDIIRLWNWRKGLLLVDSWVYCGVSASTEACICKTLIEGKVANVWIVCKTEFWDNCLSHVWTYTKRLTSSPSCQHKERSSPGILGNQCYT